MKDEPQPEPREEPQKPTSSAQLFDPWQKAFHEEMKRQPREFEY